MKHATPSAWAVRILISITVLFALSVTSSATTEESDTDLAKKTQNPVANLISLPFQNNTSYNSGPRERTQNVTNIQPVIPLSINDEWNLITRTIFPIVSEPSSVPGQNRQTGIGDTTFTPFLSPKEPTFGSLIWGAGPIVNIPTASDERLGADLWGMGISAVGLTIQGPIVAGAVISNTWNLEGEDFSRFLLQYFVNYNLGDGWYIVSSPIMTADWEADDNAWTIPVGGGFGKVETFGKLPVNFSVRPSTMRKRPSSAGTGPRDCRSNFCFPNYEYEDRLALVRTNENDRRSDASSRALRPSTLALQYLARPRA